MLRVVVAFGAIALGVSASTYFGVAADTSARRAAMFAAHGVAMVCFLILALKLHRCGLLAWRNTIRGSPPVWDPFAPPIKYFSIPASVVGRRIGFSALAVMNFMLTIVLTGETALQSSGELRAVSAGWLLVAVIYVCWASVLDRWALSAAGRAPDTAIERAAT